MKRTLAVVLVLAFAPAAAAQLYKYVDKNGKTVYSDQAPPAGIDAKPINVPATATGVASPAPGAKSYVERDKELDKTRKEARTRQEKAEQEAQKAREAEQRCQQARIAHQAYSDGGRIYKYDAKGERAYLGDDELVAERERARRLMDEACKD